jgi:hypothetical protein
MWAPILGSCCFVSVDGVPKRALLEALAEREKKAAELAVESALSEDEAEEAAEG